MIQRSHVKFAPYLILTFRPSSGICAIFWKDMDKFISVTSLLISSVALFIVAMSLAYQARQTKLSREENMRTYHRELLLMSINDASLRKCWGGGNSPIEGKPEEQQRQLIFANLIFSWYAWSYSIDDITDAQLRINLISFFRGEIGREYWRSGRSRWMILVSASKFEKRRKFAQIADACYRSILDQMQGS
ncbi:DUF6082 family protein [Streptomyces sp. NPDC002962]|uniref:DUF6082 family protein n=1 Tax=Streptomyces sp. NPDC002962 TaxID=3364674 RepID=UPI0036893D7D